MIVYQTKHTNKRRTSKQQGSGLINKLINKLPIEIHIPGYNYCGPGTKLEKRLQRGDKGINPLDEACKEHDLAYNKHKDLKSRHTADRILADKALQRFKASDSSLGEKLSALGVSGIMKSKTTLGMGLRKGRRRHKIKKYRRKKTFGKGISFKEAVRRARKGIVGRRYTKIKDVIKAAMSSIKAKKVFPPKNRIIPIPKLGGFLPLIPLFAGLSALGALGGGAAGIAKAVNDAKDAKAKLEEEKRHNKKMEDISVGKGLYLTPYKKGCGLYLKPYSKNC